MHANSVNFMLEKVNNLQRGLQEVREYVLGKLSYGLAEGEYALRVDQQVQCVAAELERLKDKLKATRSRQ